MRGISIGAQWFDEIREQGAFYVDKTSFIKEWWEDKSPVTLITRPRRFGKTLNMSMLECFFSNRYAGRGDLFEGLDIWKEEKYRSLQGTYPVIFLSFANIKEQNYADAREAIARTIGELFMELKNEWMNDSDEEKSRYSFMQIGPESSNVQITRSLHDLTDYMKFRYGKKVLIFLDEYDTPLQEAYVNGYWDEMSGLIRSLFNSTFKTNPSMERAVLTGITRVSRESIFSGLNNPNVISTTSTQYETAFGFTEKEVSDALEEYGFTEDENEVRRWYDGFTFGTKKNIYNPWSIINYLKSRRFRPYWANSSDNGLINYELRYSNNETKHQMENLVKGETLTVSLDEEIIFSQLEENPKALWSLFLAAGYLKACNWTFDGKKEQYTLALTNLEVEIMFENMISGWFDAAGTSNEEFIRGMLRGDTGQMNLYMNRIAALTFSSFDSGKHPSESTAPERFYHGFVLGLLVKEQNRYRIRSNRESGYGRYDICMFPKEKSLPGIVIEFKVQDPETGETELSDTVNAALSQIREKRYSSDLEEEGVKTIYEYGFAFAGKTVLIGKG